MPKIFINYRRLDSEGYVGRLFDSLSNDFGPDSVFMDVATLQPGGDIKEEIEESVKACDVFLIIIGKQWLNITSANGSRRLDNPNDFVRYEIKLALENGLHIIPILIQDSLMPNQAELPSDIAPLALRNAFTLRHDKFIRDYEQLEQNIKTYLQSNQTKDDFESETALFLQFAGFYVEFGKQIGNKKINILIQEKRLGSIRRVAVECFNYRNPLTLYDINETLNAYQNILEENLLDEVLILSVKGINDSANDRIKTSRVMFHITFNDLQNSLMDFGPYLMNIVKSYGSDGLSYYYVDPKAANYFEDQRKGIRQDLEKFVRNWIDSPPSTPIAILGSYGMGKTSFARRLAFALANEYFEDNRKRIPILLRLGDISSEQSLEGLLGKAFTATSLVRNYNFDIFMALNAAGRFVILLDGFDEMKHTLSWSEFRYNFRQLNRLVVTNSKVILLGRPTAFLNDDEQNFALHGIRNFHEQQIREQDWPDYTEVHVASFNPDQINVFLNKYFKYTKMDSELIDYQISRLTGRQLSDITKRPVQLKMLAEVLPQWQGDIDNLTVTILYSYFIDLIIEREQEKISRRKFGLEDRRDFAKKISWWLWTNKKVIQITADDIPEEIISHFSENQDEYDDIKRDLVAACFLERKLGESLYFPHRSFQEYLVAEYIIENLSSNTISITDVNPWVTSEIANFIIQLIGTKELDNWSAQLENFRGQLSWEFARVWVSVPKFIPHIASRIRNTKNPWNFLFMTLTIINYQNNDKVIQYLEDITEAISPWIKSYECLDSDAEILTNDIKNFRLTKNHLVESNNSEKLYLVLLCLLVLYAYRGVDIAFSLALNNLFSDFCDVGCKAKVKDKQTQKEKTVFIPARVTVNLISKIFVNQNRKCLEIRAVIPHIQPKLSVYCLISDWVAGKTIKVERPLPSEIPLNSETLQKILSFQKQYCHLPES